MEKSSEFFTIYSNFKTANPSRYDSSSLHSSTAVLTRADAVQGMAYLTSMIYHSQITDQEQIEIERWLDCFQRAGESFYNVIVIVDLGLQSSLTDTAEVDVLAMLLALINTPASREELIRLIALTSDFYASFSIQVLIDHQQEESAWNKFEAYLTSHLHSAKFINSTLGYFAAWIGPNDDHERLPALYNAEWLRHDDRLAVIDALPQVGDAGLALLQQIAMSDDEKMALRAMRCIGKIADPRCCAFTEDIFEMTSSLEPDALDQHMYRLLIASALVNLDHGLADSSKFVQLVVHGNYFSSTSMKQWSKIALALRVFNFDQFVIGKLNKMIPGQLPNTITQEQLNLMNEILGYLAASQNEVASDTLIRLLNQHCTHSHQSIAQVIIQTVAKGWVRWQPVIRLAELFQNLSQNGASRQGIIDQLVALPDREAVKLAAQELLKGSLGTAEKARIERFAT